MSSPFEQAPDDVLAKIFAHLVQRDEAPRVDLNDAFNLGQWYSLMADYAARRQRRGLLSACLASKRLAKFAQPILYSAAIPWAHFGSHTPGKPSFTKRLYSSAAESGAAQRFVYSHMMAIRPTANDGGLEPLSVAENLFSLHIHMSNDEIFRISGFDLLTALTSATGLRNLYISIDGVGDLFRHKITQIALSIPHVTSLSLNRPHLVTNDGIASRQALRELRLLASSNSTKAKVLKHICTTHLDKLAIESSDARDSHSAVQNLFTAAKFPKLHRLAWSSLTGGSIQQLRNLPALTELLLKFGESELRRAESAVRAVEQLPMQVKKLTFTISESSHIWALYQQASQLASHLTEIRLPGLICNPGRGTWGLYSPGDMRGALLIRHLEDSGINVITREIGPWSTV